jgi:dTDP-4-amino-4,6-dideoxygalactose transaminase
MRRHELKRDDHHGDGHGSYHPDRTRRYRLVPPAITPVGFDDVSAGVLGQIRGTGREQFRADIEGVLDADSSATYTSFRRTLAGCFRTLAAAGEDDRREVLVPAFCSPDYPEVIENVGLHPVRYDVDPATLSADASSLDGAIGEGTLAVVAINVLGYGSPMDELADRCERAGAFLAEALGYALGTTYDGRRLGTFGDCAILNFQQGKPIPVGGGMVTSRNRRLSFDDADRPAVGANVAALAGYAALSHPRPYYAYSRLKERLDGITDISERATTHHGAPSEDAETPPFGTISNFQGTVAGRVFDRLEEHRSHRERTADFYADALADCPAVSRVEPYPGLSTLQHVRYPLLAETESLRDRIGAALGRAGIQTTKLYDWPPIDGERFPGAERLQRTILTLPTHPYVDDRDRRLVVDTVRDVASSGTGAGSDQR